MIPRLAVVAVALAMVALLASTRRHHDACESARSTVFEVTLGHLPRARQPDAIETVRRECRGTTALLAAAGALHRQRDDRGSLALAREAVAREPDNAAAWAALETAAATQAPALARAADRRLATLDPLGRLSLNLSTGRSTR